MKIILALIIHGFIVNQVASDGAQEIVSAIIQMTTTKSKRYFSSLKKKQETIVAFKHPCCKNIDIFNGYVMSHWIEKCVNHLELLSNSDTTQNMKFRGKYLNLEMIEKV